MNPATRIQDILQSLDAGRRNSIESIYLNTVKNEFITFPGRIVIPKISVKQLTYDLAVNIVNELCSYIPEYLIGHRLMEERKPAADLHSLQFIAPLRGRLLDFTHFFKVDFRFGGDSYNIVEKGNTEFYPSYMTNRVYFKSRIIPSSPGKTGEAPDLRPLRLVDAQYVESDQAFHTFAVFDEVSTRKITKELLAKLNLKVFNVSTELYPFIVYDFFTACFNVLAPRKDELQRAVELFEPVFLYTFAMYKKLDTLAPVSEIREKFGDCLSFAGEAPSLKDEFVERLKNYFLRFSIFRDDELAVKGWWRLDVAD